jgi:hypothetical protein
MPRCPSLINLDPCLEILSLAGNNAFETRSSRSSAQGYIRRYELCLPKIDRMYDLLRPLLATSLPDEKQCLPLRTTGLGRSEESW